MGSKALYRVESGVPLPRGRGVYSYPLREMSVGDSFEFGPGDDEADRVWWAAMEYAKRNDGVRFAMRRRMRRLWRVA